MSTIHQLVKRNNRAGVAKMLEGSNKKEVANKRDTAEQSPLHIASFEGFVDLVVLLLVNGASPAAVDRSKWTPLHCAAHTGQLAIAEILLDQGASPAALTNEGASPLHYLVRFNLPKTDKPLFRRVLALMLEKGADANGQNQHGETPLHQACFRGRKPSVKLLLAHHAQTNLRSKFGETPLHFAARKGDAKIVRLLLAHGADASVRGDMGTAREVALSCHPTLAALHALFGRRGDSVRDSVRITDGDAPSASLSSSQPVLRVVSPVTLPLPLLARIFACLPLEALPVVARVCSVWRRATQDGELWRRTYTTRHGRVKDSYLSSIGEAFDWRRAFNQAVRLQSARCDIRALTGHTGKLQALHLDERQPRLITAASELKLWDLATLQCVQTVNRGGPYNAVQLAGDHVIGACEDKTVKVWDVRSAQIVRTLLGHDAAVQRLQCDGTRLVSSGADGRVILWDLAQGSLVRTFVHDKPCSVRSFYFDRERLAVGITLKDSQQPQQQQQQQHHQLSLWHLRTGSLVRSLPGIYAGCLQFRPEWLLAAKDNRVKLWDMKSGRCLRTLRLIGPKANVTACWRYGDLVVVGDEAGNVRLFDAQTAHCWRTLQPHRERIVALQFNGKLCCSASTEGIVKLWDVL